MSNAEKSISKRTRGPAGSAANRATKSGGKGRSTVSGPKARNKSTQIPQNQGK